MSQVPSHYVKQPDGSFTHPANIKAHPGRLHPVHAQPMTIKPSTDIEKLNKTEKAFHQHLVCMNYSWLGVQNVTLKLADDCRLTCDFSYLDKDSNLVLVDVKGFQREDALIKIKVAARQFPWIKFLIVKKVKGGGWDIKEVRV